MNREGIGLGNGDHKETGGTSRRVTIWVESEWGKGTTTFFRIPMIVDAASERTLQAG